MWDWGALLLFLFRGGQRAALSWAPRPPVAAGVKPHAVRADGTLRCGGELKNSYIVHIFTSQTLLSRSFFTLSS